MPQPLTRLERRILSYLMEYLRRNTYQPSVREIGKRFAIKSTKTVSEHLQALADKGYIERDPSRSRGVKLLGLQLSPELLQLPLHGTAAAGGTATLEPRVETRFAVDRRLVESEDAFVLQVSGNSMDGIGITDGDLVFVEPAEMDAVPDGAVVAVSLNGEPLIKRWFVRNGTVVLESCNPEYEPVLVGEAEDLAILGRVAGLFRRFSEGTLPVRA